MGAGKLAAAMQSPSRKPSKVIAGLLKSSMIPVQHVISDSATEESQENRGKNGTTTGGILNVTKTSLGRVLRRKGTHFWQEFWNEDYCVSQIKTKILDQLMILLVKLFSFDIISTTAITHFKTRFMLEQTSVKIARVRFFFSFFSWEPSTLKSTCTALKTK